MDLQNNIIVDKEGAHLTLPEDRTHTGSDIASFTLYPNHDEAKVTPTRRDLNLQTSYGFLVDDFMSAEECQFYIEESMKKGYRTIEKEFPKEYRNNTRYLGKSKKLSDILWNRLQYHFKSDEIENVKPYGFDQEGIWIPLGLDDCFTFGRYEPGGRFKPHLDATYAESPDTRSIYTMQIYLNDDYEGGKTNFYLPANPLELEKHVMTESVQPRRGTALIFNHDTLHEGAQVTNGVKYILRVDMMFMRIKKDKEMSEAHKAGMQRARELFFKADSLEKDTGDLESAIATYVKAQMLLAALPSVEQSTPTSTTTTATTTSTAPIADKSIFVVRPKAEPATINSLSEWLMFGIFYNCSLKDIISLRSTCKSMLKMFTKNAFWKKMYVKLFSYEAFIFEEPNAERLDQPKKRLTLLEGITRRFQRLEITPTESISWFVTVQNVFTAHTQHKFVYLDIGRNLTKHCLLNSAHQVLPSRASIHYEYAPHYAMSSFDREYWNVGYNASYNHQIPVDGGEFDVNRLQCTVEIIKFILTSSFSRRFGSTHPYILTLTPPMIEKSAQIQFLLTVRKKQYNNTVLYKDAGLCVLQSHGLDTGIVVMFGASATFIITYLGGKLTSYVNFPVNGLKIGNYIKEKYKSYNNPKELSAILPPATYSTRGQELNENWFKMVTVSMEYSKDVSKTSIGESVLYTAPELMFYPGIGDGMGDVGIVERTVNCIANVLPTQLPNIKHVVLTGGFSSIPNYRERFTRDFNIIHPNIQVVMSEEPIYDTLVGAKIDQSLSKSLHEHLNQHANYQPKKK